MAILVTLLIWYLLGYVGSRLIAHTYGNETDELFWLYTLGVVLGPLTLIMWIAARVRDFIHRTPPTQ